MHNLQLKAVTIQYVATFAGKISVQRMSDYFIKFTGCVRNEIERSIRNITITNDDLTPYLKRN